MRADTACARRGHRFWNRKCPYSQRAQDGRQKAQCGWKRSRALPYVLAEVMYVDETNRKSADKTPALAPARAAFDTSKLPRFDVSFV
jgi:hypothetical protein